MKGPWKVTSNVIDGQKMYAVYRLLDTSETDHSGNREYATGWLDDKDQAVETAQQLNAIGNTA